MYGLNNKFILVIGASASGKSEYAENLCLHLSKGNKLYIATMEPYGDDAKFRIDRHRKLRKTKGFDTLEKYTNLGEVKATAYDTILLECMSTLLANEMFITNEYKKNIIQGIDNFKMQVPNLVIISNNVFTDGVKYEQQTEAYIKALAEINITLAQKADIVIEVICGIPIVLKGETNYEESYNIFFDV
ncbi:MAG: hypothetical protein BEN19_04995 [Epulopiscium sp. Nuni2H_MBin003]|nr:MAG: hypothetical protein BEN19_04995 [Epulopiscium sp. Nuni2H_MBin003]